MGRESYDDMVGSARRRGKGSNSRILLIAVLGILICAIAILVYLIVSSPDLGGDDESASTQTPLTVEIKEPQVIAPATTSEETSLAETSSPEPTDTATPSLTAETVRPSSGSQRTTAVDLISAQDAANFDVADYLIYLTYTVQEGDTLASIAEAYGLKPSTLVSVNNIVNISAITPGVQLRIPNMDGQLYTVQDGDMLSTITRRFNPSLGWRQLMDVNRLDSENIRVGQVLFIPDVEEEETVSLQVPTISFVQPAQGTIYGSLGQYYNGMQLNGVLIRSTLGSPVVAASSGVVTDVGNSPEAGRFVIIQHDQTYRTSYYFLESTSVNVGDELLQGDEIGTVGTSDMFTSPTLYFTLDQGGINLNPEAFF